MAEQYNIKFEQPALVQLMSMLFAFDNDDKNFKLKQLRKSVDVRGLAPSLSNLYET